MNGLSRRLAPFRAVLAATGFWGVAWAVWVVGGVIVQAIMNARQLSTPEYRQYVNLVFSVGTLGLMYVVLSRVREWQQAQTPPPPTPDADPDNE